MTPRRALIVTDGAAPQVPAAVRALHAGGWTVGLALGGSRQRRSRHAATVVAVPAPERDPEAWVAAVAAVAGDYDVVFAADDIELLVLSAARDAIPCVVPHAPHAAVLRAVDKLELTRAATRAGLHAPFTRPATEAALAAVDGPVVVKSRLHWEPGAADGQRHALAARCDGRDAARRHAEAMTSSGARPLLQELVDGELMALTLLADREGRCIAAVQQRSPRLSLRDTSSRAVTTAIDPDLLAAAGRLLRDLGWVGLANLQFLRAPGAPPALIDLNARFYGSLALAVAAGVDLPGLWGRVALGDPVPSWTAGRPGVRFQSLLEDLRRARAERSGGLVRDVAGTLTHALGATHPHLSASDPRPALGLVRELAAARRPRPRA